MPNIASVLKSEIARLARKEVRAEADALRKITTQQRTEIAALKRDIKQLQSVVKKVSRGARSSGKEEVVSATGEDSGKRLRFSPTRLASQRKRLGLSAQAFGALVGVTGQSIYKWETGGARPRDSQLRAIAKVRAMGKREARARLDELGQE